MKSMVLSFTTLCYIAVFQVIQVAAQGETRFSCGFEENEGMCTFIQDKTDDPKNPDQPNPDLNVPGASFDWDRLCGNTPTVGTGPSTGAEGSTCFAFIETSDPQDAGDEARMTTPALNNIGQMCVDFFYHMRGPEIGSLIVYLQTGSEYTQNTQNRVVFQENGEKGNEWLQARFTVQMTNNQDRVGFLGRKGPDYRGDIGLDNIQITTGNCDGTFEPVNLPFSCSFETELICNFVQSTSDTAQFDWIRNSGATPTDNTGPSFAQAGQYYMYIETSDPRREGHFAVLQTPPINFNGAVCLDMGYHMFGEDIGSLEIFTTSRGMGDPWRQITGDQGNLWRTAMIDITLQQNDRIGILARRGRDIRGDIAIDMVEIFSGPCEGDLPFLCTFETDTCGMFQRPTGESSSQDDFDWTRQSGPTDSEGTGPPGAAFGIYYVYIEASLPRTEGNEATIESPSIRYQGDVCLRFSYHMYDSTNQNMGRLRVFRSASGNTIFDVNGNQGNNWLQAEINTQLTFNERIVFSGFVGRDIQGDIALDNIGIQQGRCTETPTPTASPGTGEETGEIMPVYSCDGEGDGSSQTSCRLRQDSQDNMQWIMNTGRTASGRLGDRRINGINYPITGPSGAYQGSRYMYIEASGRPDGDMARLVIEGSNVITTGNACLRFAFNMNGFHMGVLQVYVIENGVRKEKWRMHGDQQQNWLLGAADLRMNSVSQVGFEAYTKGEFSGDIALDSIQLNGGRCSTVPSGYVWQCNFETSNGAAAFCDMEQSTSDTQNYDWDLWRGGTPSEDTGPSFPYNGQYYLYMEASDPHRPGDSASILLPRLFTTGSMCVEFRYYMYGHHMGRLEIFLRQNGADGQQLFTISGEKEQVWRQGRVGISNVNSNDQIGFRGYRGTEFSGDIALDQIRVRQGTCTSTESA